MPPPRPMLSAFAVASPAEGTPWVRPMATPAADSAAISSTARPLAHSQPKNAAPHLIPPKRSCCASTASRATPLLARAPEPAVLFRKVVSGEAVVVFGEAGGELVAMRFSRRQWGMDPGGDAGGVVCGRPGVGAPDQPAAGCGRPAERRGRSVRRPPRAGSAAVGVGDAAVGDAAVGDAAIGGAVGVGLDLLL